MGKLCCFRKVAKGRENKFLSVKRGLTHNTTSSSSNSSSNPRKFKETQVVSWPIRDNGQTLLIFVPFSLTPPSISVLRTCCPWSFFWLHFNLMWREKFFSLCISRFSIFSAPRNFATLLTRNFNKMKWKHFSRDPFSFWHWGCLYTKNLDKVNAVLLKLMAV